MDERELAIARGLFVTLVQMLMFSLSTDTSDNFLVTDITNPIAYKGDNRFPLLVVSTALHDKQVQPLLFTLSSEMRWWVKPRSTAWFSQFLLTEYDDSRWLQHFRMTKDFCKYICGKLAPLIRKRDTNYREAIPVEARVCIALYKLCQGANILTCSEMFAVGRSTVGLVLREVVWGLNIVFRDLVRWPTGDSMRENMFRFKDLSGLPSVHGVLDGTHIPITKPKIPFASDYYYYKSGKYSMNVLAVVDSKKRFINVYAGMPRSVNDSRVLRTSGLYKAVTQDGLLNMERGSLDNQSPYIIADKCYPCLPWLMPPHKRRGLPFTIHMTLYNKHISKVRVVVENAFGILKLSFMELLSKCWLDVRFIPDVVMACCIMHNLLLQNRDRHIEELMESLAQQVERDRAQANHNREDVDDEATDAFADMLQREAFDGSGDDRREELAAYLARNN